MPALDTQHLRNIALVSHSGAGKTSIAEAMLLASGTISRQGRVDDGTTVTDYEPEEIKRNSSIQTSLAPCLWSDHKINVIDTPGYPDFVGEAISGLRAADAAVVVVAAHAGVEVGTQEVWQICEEASLPRIIFINKMDRENADFGRTLESVQQALGKRCTAIHVAIGAQQQFEGVIDLMDPPADVPASVAADVERLRGSMVETVVETDDDLVARYLEGEEISQEELAADLKKGVLSGQIVPVLAGSTTNGKGITELLDAVVNLLPSPAEAAATRASTADGEVQLEARADGPLATLVFKTTADAYVGTLSYLRVFSGTIKSDSQVWNSQKGQAERIGQLFTLRGKTQEQTNALVAGDIGGVAKLAATSTGDSLTQRDQALTLEPIRFPDPVNVSAIYPKSKADFDKMSNVLARLVEEDPSLHVRRESATGETLLDGMGDTHIDVAVEKAKRKFGVELEATVPKVAYMETISVSMKTEYKHKKQTGGHGQYGHVKIELEPLPRGGGFEFAQRVVGGNVPKEYIPSVEKGIVKSLQEGVVAGYPIVDLKVVLYDGSSHPVDSSGMAFEIAGSYALKKGFAEASPVLLEPIMYMEVTVPDSFTGDVMGDLNGKRARILGMAPSGGVTTIEAEVPQAEVSRYATDLRSMTQGRGRFKTEFTRYEEVPAHLMQRIAGEAKSETPAKA